MPGPTGSVILSLYEQGMAAGPAKRAALLCAAAGADEPARDLPLGDLDRQIWALHKTLFHGAQEATAACAHCGVVLEFTLPPDFSLPDRQDAELVEVSYAGEAFQVRMPRLSDVASGRIDFDRLAPGAPWDRPEFVDLVEAALEAADPGLHVSIALTCHACQQVQSQVFDAVGFSWANLEQGARRLIRETARLARAFGWSESDILGMTPQRRALYLAELAP